jgi:ubiquinone/menaquinone biosynthesis C-methylase UbiE
MSSPISSPDPAKLQLFRQRLHQEWTGEQTVAAWRKWSAQIATFTRGVTDALLETAELRPGMRVLDLASGVGDPALSLAALVGPSGSVTASDIGPDMFSLAQEIAKKQGVTNIEFRIANAESLPFPDASYDALTCRFGIMFFPDLAKSLRECLRVLKPGGRATFVAFGNREQPFAGTTVGVLSKYVQMPPLDPDAPNMFMFGQRDRLRLAMVSAGFSNVREEFRTVPGRWSGSLEQYWQQFTEVGAPFRALISQLTPQNKAAVAAEVVAALGKFWNGREMIMPLEIVVGSGTRP